MPTPDPIVDGPNANADGTTTTTTTTFHPNGSKKSVSKEIRDPKPDDTLRKKTVDKFKKGGGPGDDGDRTSSTSAEVNDNGDEIGYERTKFKKGKKKTKITRKTVYAPPPPRRVTVTIKYCPDGIIEKTKTTRVFYKPERTWREEPRERETINRSCKTGKKLALNFSDDKSDYVMLALVTATVIFAVAGWEADDRSYWSLGFISFVAAAYMYRNYLLRMCESEKLVIEMYEDALDLDDDDDEPVQKLKQPEPEKS